MVAASSGPAGHQRPGQTEWRSFGVAADRPALPRMHNLSAQFDDLLECGLQVGDRQVGQREAVAGAAAALVEPDGRTGVLCLQALALLRPPLGERDVEEALPEAAGAVEVVRRELDQETAQISDPASSAKPHSRQTKRLEVCSSRMPIVTPQAGQMGGRSSSPVSRRRSCFTA